MDENKARAVLKAGLHSKHVRVAEAAGKYAVFLAKNTDLDLKTLLYESFEHWKEKEEPYPQNGGIIPHSPREDLLRALALDSNMNELFLVELFSDPRSDVRTLAEELGLKLAIGEARNNMIDVAIEREHLGFVKRLISSKHQIASQQVKAIGKLHASDSSTGRLCSLMLVENGYCSDRLAAKIVDALSSDSLLIIRNRVSEYKENSSFSSV